MRSRATPPPTTTPACAGASPRARWAKGERDGAGCGRARALT
jgi:hypothetical protein